MARPREPINLLEAKGRKHLTKAEIEERRKSEVKAPADRIKALAYLTAELKEEFEKITKQLTDIGIMTNLDVDALARFIIAREIYIKLFMQIIRQPVLMVSDKYPQIAINQDKAFKQCSTAARDLGLTISSRCRLVISKSENEKDGPNGGSRREEAKDGRNQGAKNAPCLPSGCILIRLAIPLTLFFDVSPFIPDKEQCHRTGAGVRAYDGAHAVNHDLPV